MGYIKIWNTQIEDAEHKTLTLGWKHLQQTQDILFEHTQELTQWRCSTHRTCLIHCTHRLEHFHDTHITCEMLNA